MDKNDEEIKSRIKGIAESIFYNSGELNDLMNMEGKYVEAGSNFVRILNAYLDMTMSSTYNYGSDIFDTINLLNDKYGFDKQYSYKDYVGQDNTEVSKSFVSKLLCDDIYYELFYDFNNNKKYFKKSIEAYMIALDNFVSYVELSGKKLKPDAEKRFQNIMNKYGDKIKRKHAMYGNVKFEDINSDRIVTVYKNVVNSMDKFVIARSVYLELCKKFQVEFLSSEDKDFEKSLSWAKEYVYLLKRYAINATVCGEQHKYVICDINGMLIKADATMVLKDQYGLGVNDLLRTKIGFNTVGFNSYDKHVDITERLKNADKECGYENENINNFTNKLVDYYKNTGTDGSSEFVRKLSLLSYHVNNSVSVGTEWLTYMAIIIDLLFNRNGKLVNYTYMALNNGDCYVPCVVLSMESGGGIAYISLVKGSSLKQISQEQLEEMINSEKLSILSNKDLIKGLEKACEMQLQKRKK